MYRHCQLVFLCCTSPKIRGAVWNIPGRRENPLKLIHLLLITGVVKGTLVLSPQPPDLGGLKPVPETGRAEQTLPSPNLYGPKESPIQEISQIEQSPPPPEIGGTEGGSMPERVLYARPIESIQSGDLVIGYDGQPHRVLSTQSRRYHGPMITIQHDQSDQTLTLTADQLILTQRKVQQITPNGNWSGIPPDHFTYARTLRKEASPPERVLWRFLRNEQLGVKFRRQHPIGPYIADFYTREASLVVEVDGCAIHGSPEQAAYDAERDRFMQNLGLTVLRIPARDVLHQTQSVVSLILTYTREQILTNDRYKQWRCAKNIKVGDTIYRGPELSACKVTDITKFESVQDVVELEVEDAHYCMSIMTLVHNSASSDS